MIWIYKNAYTVHDSYSIPERCFTKERKSISEDVFIKMSRLKIRKVFQKDVFIKMSRQKIVTVFQKDVFIKM